jgi:hypothetical protein
MKKFVLFAVLLIAPAMVYADVCPHYEDAELQSMPINKVQDLEATLYSNGCFIESDRVNRVLHARLAKKAKSNNDKKKIMQETYFQSLGGVEAKTDPCMSLTDSDAKASCTHYKYSQPDCTRINPNSTLHNDTKVSDCLNSNAEQLAMIASRLNSCVQKFPHQESDPAQWRSKMACIDGVTSTSATQP